MTNIEVARLVTAIIMSGIIGYAIGFISSYIITWHSAVDIFKEYKITIEGWKSAYDELMGYWMESRLR